MADEEPQPHLLDESVPRRTRRMRLSSLSDDILEQTLARLSFPEVYRLRSVCKRWNALIRAQFEECGALPWGPFHSARVMWQGTGSRAVPWFAWDLSEGTMRETITPQLEFPECARSACWVLIAASGGLLCFGALGGRHFTLRRKLVCNPMTKAWRELPALNLHYKDLTFYDSHWVMITHMVVDKCGSSYKILVAGNKGVDVYNSVADKWTAVEPLSPEMSFRSGVYCNGHMYLMRSSSHHMVMILELATLRWREDTIPMPSTSLYYPHIVAWSGEVYLVGGSSEITNTRSALESILLFRLDPGGRWTRVSEHANHAGAIYGCGAHGGRIFVVTLGWVAVYNCSTCVWEEPVMGSFRCMKNIYGTKFAFQPNLVAAP